MVNREKKLFLLECKETLLRKQLWAWLNSSIREDMEKIVRNRDVLRTLTREVKATPYEQMTLENVEIVFNAFLCYFEENNLESNYTILWHALKEVFAILSFVSELIKEAKELSSTEY